MEIKKLRWWNPRLKSLNKNKRKIIDRTATFKVFGYQFFITNIKNYNKGKSIIEKNVFYLNYKKYFKDKHGNNSSGYSRTIKCTSLKDAKEKANRLCEKLIIQTFYKPVPTRKVFTEKRKQRKLK